MEDGSQTETSNVTETPLGGQMFSGTIESKDPMAQPTIPAPEGIPEKFWDPIAGQLRTDDLVKSYQALEAKLGQPKAVEAEVEGADESQTDEAADESQTDVVEGEDKADEADESKADEAADEDKAEDVVEAPEFAAAMEAAQAVYAETGELPEEQRKPFLDLGFSNQQIDLYLNGVKATEAALHTAAYEAAGDEQTYQAAVAWAAKNWSPKQVQAFNSMTGDVETIGPAVAGLMAEFRKAEPGEGSLANINSGTNRGDVYETMDEFQADLSAADKVRDKVARRKAVAKLRRSREAGTIKHSNRRQPFGGR